MVSVGLAHAHCWPPAISPLCTVSMSMDVDGYSALRLHSLCACVSASYRVQRGSIGCVMCLCMEVLPTAYVCSYTCGVCVCVCVHCASTTRSTLKWYDGKTLRSETFVCVVVVAIHPLLLVWRPSVIGGDSIQHMGMAMMVGATHEHTMHVSEMVRLYWLSALGQQCGMNSSPASTIRLDLLWSNIACYGQCSLRLADKVWHNRSRTLYNCCDSFRVCMCF